MIKLLSNQKTYDLFYSGDEAIVPLPDDASDKQIAERARQIEVALESGRWDDVTVPGQTVTRFRMRQLTAEEYGEIASGVMNGGRPFDNMLLAFRLALQDATPLPDGIKVGFTTAGGRKLATTTFLDKLGCSGELGAEIIMELGQRVFDRAKEPSPKS